MKILGPKFRSCIVFFFFFGGGGVRFRDLDAGLRFQVLMERFRGSCARFRFSGAVVKCSESGSGDLGRRV